MFSDSALAGRMGLLGWPWLGRAPASSLPCHLGPGLPPFLLPGAGCGCLHVLCSASPPARQLGDFGKKSRIDPHLEDTTD